jgi:D-glycero-alpha-D-manno-heptose-7-phosphate kinase
LIISRTPLRMSFIGGGSDMRAFYAEHPGAVLSTAVNKYVFVTVNRKFDDGVRVAYSKTEEVASAAEVEHRLVRAALTRLGLKGGMEITTVADIPSRGTGLGSSSSFTVGLLNALSAFKGQYVTREYLACESCEIEINVCGEPIGKQDQYAAAYGGFNLIEFLPDEAVRVTPVVIPPVVQSKLQSQLMVFYTGKTRSASALLAKQTDAVNNDAAKRKVLKRMVELTHQVKAELESGNLDAFGDALHENWELKKSLTEGISSDDIDRWYDTGRTAGALGGKILGAGAGGFLLLFAPPDRHAAIEHQLPELRRVKMGFEPIGSQIIFYNPPE